MIEAQHTAQDVLRLRTLVVNCYLVRSGSSWVLVDAGLSGFARLIAETAEKFSGSSRAPDAIILTHGHFDHVGSLGSLLDRWDVPVYAHRLESPYLKGRSPYPPPDPLVGRGSMALLSRLYPRAPLDLGSRLQLLPEDGTVPGLTGWRCVFTPGHTAGHVSLFRESDRTLLAGDAVTTVQQESVLAVATQRQELHGPPAYFTQDWQSAGWSVGTLAALEPEVLATGHGVPMGGPAMRTSLHELADGFRLREVPRFGRYSKQPAITDESGIVALPPDPFPKVAVSVAGAAIAIGLLSQMTRSRAAHR
jgi:glyoxylase-like metal-dependent hydrolase (beta-lactamase superfamily II)